jgi:hypothetical protein
MLRRRQPRRQPDRRNHARRIGNALSIFDSFKDCLSDTQMVTAGFALDLSE